MEITPGSPEYSCPTLIGVIGTEGNDHSSPPPTASWPIEEGEDGATRGRGAGENPLEEEGGATQS